MAAPETALVIIKSFPYKLNAAEEWSNKYMLTGTTPTTPALWRTLFDALVNEEKKLFMSPVRIIKGYAYDSVADDATAVWSVDLRVPPDTYVAAAGTLTSVIQGPGDSAMWIRWGLNRMVRGKRVYLRKYYHPALLETASPDQIRTTWATVANAFATKLTDGTFLDGRTLTDKLGTTVLNHGVSTYATTRTLKRRGKRPPTSA